MAGFLEHQPVKGLYLTYFFGSLILVKIPFIWCIKYLSRSWRPRPTWTIKRSIIVRSIQELMTIKTKPSFDVHDFTKEVPDSTLKDAKFTWLDPTSDRPELICGEVRCLAELTGVQPARIAGYWYLKKGTVWNGPKAQPGEKVVLHMHGGAFIVRFKDDFAARITQLSLEFFGNNSLGQRTPPGYRHRSSQVCSSTRALSSGCSRSNTACQPRRRLLQRTHTLLPS